MPPKKPTADAPEKPASGAWLGRGLLRVALWSLGLATAGVLSVLVLLAVALSVAYPNLPDISELSDYRPKLPLRVISADGVLLGLGKFKRIREIDFDNRVVVTEPGVTNLAISQAVAHAGFYYAPDPSSQIACSIGGNVAENSGGVHCLKYGMTTNNVLGCEIVLMSGEILRIGGKSAENAGYDLMGIITGSEGLLGVITEITVRILQKPETARALMVGFAEVEAAGECVAAIIGAGIISILIAPIMSRLLRYFPPVVTGTIIAIIGIMIVMIVNIDIIIINFNICPHLIFLALFAAAARRSSLEASAMRCVLTRDV